MRFFRLFEGTDQAARTCTGPRGVVFVVSSQEAAAMKSAIPRNLDASLAVWRSTSSGTYPPLLCTDRASSVQESGAQPAKLRRGFSGSRHLKKSIPVQPAQETRAISPIHEPPPIATAFNPILARTQDSRRTALFPIHHPKPTTPSHHSSSCSPFPRSPRYASPRRSGPVATPKSWTDEYRDN